VSSYVPRRAIWRLYRSHTYILCVDIADFLPRSICRRLTAQLTGAKTQIIIISIRSFLSTPLHCSLVPRSAFRTFSAPRTSHIILFPPRGAKCTLHMTQEPRIQDDEGRRILVAAAAVAAAAADAGAGGRCMAATLKD
jgi:hypothetical protein